MAIQTTPHTQTQQNVSAAQDDLENPEQLPQDSGRGEDARLYENMAGAQTGGTRAFNVTDQPANTPNVTQETAALSGRQDTRLPHSENQGITNHSANEEAARNQKVVDERADAQAGVDQTGDTV